MKESCRRESFRPPLASHGVRVCLSGEPIRRAPPHLRRAVFRRFYWRAMTRRMSDSASLLAGLVGAVMGPEDFNAPCATSERDDPGRAHARNRHDGQMDPRGPRYSGIVIAQCCVAKPAKPHQALRRGEHVCGYAGLPTTESTGPTAALHSMRSTSTPGGRPTRRRADGSQLSQAVAASAAVWHLSSER
jgi:hypothetical protein